MPVSAPVTSILLASRAAVPAGARRMRPARHSVNSRPPQANVLKVQRYAINDGPGIRTTVFLKGCPLRCQWCHNPEAMKASRQLMFNASLCLACRRCVEACPEAVHRFEDGCHVVDFSRCEACGGCVEACPNGALSLHGTVMSVEEIMDLVRRDEPYYRESGGGVTISGGEPLTQPECVEAIIAGCRQAGISVWLDTCGEADLALFQRIASRVDGVLYDLKIMDTERHRARTGAGNERILANFRALCRTDREVVVRCVVLPGINDDADNRLALACFLRECSFSGAIELLPYHRYGMGKYAHLGMSYALPHLEAPSGERMEELRGFYAAQGFSVTIR